MPHNNANALTERPDVLTKPKLEGGKRFTLYPVPASGRSADGNQGADGGRPVR